MARPKMYTEEERLARKRERQRRYYKTHSGAYEKAQIRYWIKRLRQNGYTVIEPGEERP